MAIVDDMVAAGFVPSPASPGGNITGVSILAPELDGKRQDILIELAPNGRRIAALADLNSTASPKLQALRDAAEARGVELLIHTVDVPERKRTDSLPMVSAYISYSCVGRPAGVCSFHAGGAVIAR